MQINSVHCAGLATILFDNLSGEYGFVIGRANKRYTLWKYIREDRDGVPYLIIKYIQVLSDKRPRVETRFPGVYICEELRGEKRMVLEGRTPTKYRTASGKLKPLSAPKTIDDFMSLPFGQFSGTPLREVSDWYWCKLANIGELRWTDAWDEEFDFSELVLGKCKEYGCRQIDGIWFTPGKLADSNKVCNEINFAEQPRPELEEIARQLGCLKLMGRWYPGVAEAEEKPWKATARQILPSIEAGLPFSFVAHYNGNGFWFGLPIEFLPEDKEDVYTYYGSSHFLKVTNKKGVKVNKRVKGKTIEVSEYEIIETNGNPSVLVKKFDIK